MRASVIAWCPGAPAGSGSGRGRRGASSGARRSFPRPSRGALRRRPRRAGAAWGALAAAVLASGSAAWSAPASAQTRPDLPPCPNNLLFDPGFEDGFTPRGRLDEIIPLGWSPWYATRPGIDGLNLAPRIGPRRAAGADAGLAAEGLWSIELRSEGATHTGGLRQRVAVDPGTILSASAWAFSQASNGEPGARSEPPGTYAVSLGVDPRGGEDPDGAGVRWTAPVTVTDAWLPLALEAVAEGHAVTLFTRGQALRILRRNLARWDAICLRAVGRVGEPAWPAPRPPRRAPTAGPGAPAPTRDPLVAAAVATRLHDGLEAAAAARGAPGAMSVGAGATLAAHATRIAAGPPTPDYDAWTADPPPGAALAERAGWIALALVAFVVGVLAGLGRVAS